MLKSIIIDHIRNHGPMDMYTYMQLCLTHPDYGYYATRQSTDILGVQGDFTTAPEISPLFGEMIALWVVMQWQRLGSPSQLKLVELGPGNGTLMYQVLTTLNAINSFNASCGVHLVEINPQFKLMQQTKLSALANEVVHHSSIDWLNRLQEPVVVIANEFFDALPAHQYDVSGNSWSEIKVAVYEGNLAHVNIPLSKVQPHLEYQPDTIKIMDVLCNHLGAHGGAAVIIDYGYWQGQGHSMQAVQNHHYSDILENPGKSDLSVHVNFKQMAERASACQLSYEYKTQRQFLLELGIQLRLAQVCASNPQKAAALTQGVHRIIDPAQMGQLLKVLSLYKP